MIQDLKSAATAFLLESPLNFVQPEDALRPALAGMRMFGEPLFGVASADDPLFQKLKEPGVLHPEARLPGDWLPGAKSVLSFFLPFTEAVRKANRGGPIAADEWLHARIEGQMLVIAFCDFLSEWLKERGHAALCPASSPDFRMPAPFASNWSERHTAYIAGLGTFGLSKGLITKKGMAGRFGSVITAAELPVTKREYDDLYAWCTMCGKCAKNCPAQAINPERGKDHQICSDYLDAHRQPPHGPHQRVRYGCGKCQVAVPCEMGIPAGARK